MSIKSGVSTVKAAIALSLVLSFSAVRAAEAVTPDDRIANSVKSALHSHFIRVQVLDGTVYLYGTVDTYPERATIEEEANAAAQGHKIVDSIEFSPA